MRKMRDCTIPYLNKKITIHKRKRMKANLAWLHAPTDQKRLKIERRIAAHTIFISVLKARRDKIREERGITVD